MSRDDVDVRKVASTYLGGRYREATRSRDV